MVWIVYSMERTLQILVFLTELDTVLSIFMDCFSFCIDLARRSARASRGSRLDRGLKRLSVCNASRYERSCLASDCVFVSSALKSYTICRVPIIQVRIKITSQPDPRF